MILCMTLWLWQILCFFADVVSGCIISFALQTGGAMSGRCLCLRNGLPALPCTVDSNCGEFWALHRLIRRRDTGLRLERSCNFAPVAGQTAMFFNIWSWLVIGESDQKGGASRKGSRQASHFYSHVMPHFSIQNLALTCSNLNNSF